MSTTISINKALNSFNILLNNNVVKLDEEFNTFNKITNSIEYLKESSILKEADEENSKKNILKRILDTVVKAVKWLIDKVVKLWKKLFNKSKVDKQIAEKVSNNVLMLEDKLNKEQKEEAIDKATPKLLDWTKTCLDYLDKNINLADNSIKESIEVASTIKNNTSSDTTMVDITFDANISINVGGSVADSVNSVKKLDLDLFDYDVANFEDSKLGNEIKDDLDSIEVHCDYTVNPIDKSIVLSNRIADKLKKDMEGAIACQDAVVDNLNSLNKDGLSKLSAETDEQLARFTREVSAQGSAEASWFGKNYRMYKYRSEAYKYIIKFVSSYINKANKVYEQLDIIRKYYMKNLLIINTYFANVA